MFTHGWKLVCFIIAAALIFLLLIEAPIVSAYITRKIGVESTIRTIGIWPAKTTIHHFRIANPHGFKSHTAFSAEQIEIDYRFSSLMSNPVEIDLMVLDRVTLDIEIRNPKGSDNNWAAIGAQVSRKKGGKEVVIHKLIIRDMTVVTSGAGAKVLGVSGTRHFDQMEFNEIDSGAGFPTEELIKQIFQRSGLMKYLNDIFNPVKTILKPFNLFGIKKPSDFSEGQMHS